MGGQRGLWGRGQGAHSRTQRRPRPTWSRSALGRAPGASRGGGALLQRDREQQCLVILPCTPGPDDHSDFMLVLGHLGAQRLLSEILRRDPAEKRRQRSGREGEPGEGCFPAGREGQNRTSGQRTVGLGTSTDTFS